MTVQETIRKLQLIEENLHNYLAQKQQLQSELMELESAEKALEGSSEAYKILGNVMVAQPADDMKKNIAEKKAKKTARIEAIDKQESGLKEKAESLQQEVMEQMKKDGDV